MTRFHQLLRATLALLPALASALTREQVEADIRAATTGAGASDFTVAEPATDTPSARASAWGIAPGNSGAGNYRCLVQALADCQAQGIHRLAFGPGTYALDGSASPGAPLINLKGFTDFTFDGQGALFLCQSPQVFLSLQNCARVRMTDYRLDWDWSIKPVQSLGQITAISADGTSIDLYFPHETNPSTVTPYELVEVDGATYNFIHQGLGVVGKAKLKRLTLLSGQTVRYTSGTPGYFASQGAAVGQYYVARNFEYEYPGTRVTSCRDVRFQNVTTYSTLGMGYVFRYCDHCEFLNSKIIRRPDTAWPWRFSSAADGIHCENNFGYLKFQNVEIGNAGDDAINIHDTLSQRIAYTGNPRQLKVASASAWQYPFAANDPVVICRDDFSPTGFRATVTAAGYANGQWTLTFADPVPAGLPADAIVINQAYHSDNFIVRNCTLHHNKVRGLVVHNANGTIENNAFVQNYSPGLFIICVDGPNFKEGNDPVNLIVRNNLFDGNDVKRKTFPTMPNNLVIAAETPQASPVRYPVCQNIIVEGNQIRNCPYAGIEVASARNVLVVNNTFVNPNLVGDMPLVVPGTLIIKDASAVVARNNQVVVERGVTSRHTNAYVDPATTTDVFVEPLRSKAR